MMRLLPLSSPFGRQGGFPRFYAPIVRLRVQRIPMRGRWKVPRVMDLKKRVISNIGDIFKGYFATCFRKSGIYPLLPILH